ncbi:MAG: citrate lyase acyl carrier protein [Synergistaceae bacterium]|nr:citrate lyase acyl carrier protein [Synergistaceae bacterium]
MAGTPESMDCVIVVEERPRGSGVSLTISGGERFRAAITDTVMGMLERFGLTDVDVHVQDNGARDVVLSARLEAAFVRYGKDPVPCARLCPERLQEA